VGFFRRKAPGAVNAEKESKQREAIRRRWEEHMGRMPPIASKRPEMVELRARLAECDVKASRFVGAALMGRAGGAEPPFDEMGELASEMADMLESHPVDQEELRFHIHEFTQASAIVTEAMGLQRAVP
jgi:hypothetical protein